MLCVTPESARHLTPHPPPLRAAALDALEQEQLQQQQHVLALATIVNQLTELLPRIMPALTIKSRLEMLPMVQVGAWVCAHTSAYFACVHKSFEPCPRGAWTPIYKIKGWEQAGEAAASLDAVRET